MEELTDPEIFQILVLGIGMEGWQLFGGSDELVRKGGKGANAQVLQLRIANFRNIYKWAVQFECQLVKGEGGKGSDFLEGKCGNACGNV